MISEKNYEFVKKAIQVHSRLKDREYLILYKIGANDKSKIMHTPILEENFWHLVGCKIDNKYKLDAEQKHHLYEKCLNGEDITKYLTYTRQAQDVPKKANVVIQMFDFVSCARSIRLCRTDGTPEANMFKVGAGSNKGVIGYSEESKGMIPKTAQQKSIYKIKSCANDKIYLIISKTYGDAKYDRVDYAISEKIYPTIINELPKGLLYEENLFKEK